MLDLTACFLSCMLRGASSGLKQSGSWWRPMRDIVSCQASLLLQRMRSIHTERSLTGRRCYLSLQPGARGGWRFLRCLLCLKGSFSFQTLLIHPSLPPLFTTPEPSAAPPIMTTQSCYTAYQSIQPLRRAEIASCCAAARQQPGRACSW